ncbi:binding-protein-dependent transporters inner membrane component [Planococcus antarcticus DSM 14505]|uniref:Binding-protein-dependent transporters inner membrane component n=1 Tax=Planococcus antarcticus DSM 14505 TaxID=1185653 RepID=A0A1C7DKS3_9BACL|nr:carbohydrate ABC transporter permease [Planococcus antarcticus]ANU12014.1 sugar ABC transporter permease [Planococcus antarcticus DSM 14505]EIM07996.1 binding-protein-dependent transporters inner membrane component [Planococcus antarcticus DSM 14505]
MKKKWDIKLEVFGGLLALLWLAPFYLMFVNSFKSKKEIFMDTISLPEQWSFDNYITAFEELDFMRTLFNSLLITVVSVVLIIVFSAMAAYALSRAKSRLSTVLFFTFVAAMLIPFQSVMIPLVTVFGQFEMLNRGGLIFMYLGFGASLSIFLYHGALNNVPRSLDEAATIDGANRWQVFWHIIFPILKPITVTVAILNIIWIWNDYLLPSLVINTPGSETIPLKMFFFFGEYTKQWHLALAGLTLAIVPVIIFYFFAQREIIKGVSDGAVK